MKYFVDINVVQSGAVDGLPVNTVIFAGAALHTSYINDAQKYTNYLTSNGNTLIIVFANPNMDPLNYYKIHGLKFVYWTNFDTMLSEFQNQLNCNMPTQTSPPLPTTKLTTVLPTTTSSSLLSSCLSHIPFAYDVSLSLNSDQYNAEEQFILNPFLSSLFPQQIQPSWFAIFATSSFFPRSRPTTVSDIVNFVNIYPQLNANTADIVE